MSSIEMMVKDKEDNLVLERELRLSVEVVDNMFICTITDDAGYTVTLPYSECLDSVEEITNDYYKYLIKEAEELNG